MRGGLFPALLVKSNFCIVRQGLDQLPRGHKMAATAVDIMGRKACWKSKKQTDPFPGVSFSFDSLC